MKVKEKQKESDILIIRERDRVECLHMALGANKFHRMRDKNREVNDGFAKKGLESAIRES